MTTLEERVAEMPRLVPFRSAAACALALFAVLVSAQVATAKGVPASLRVVGTSGRVLAEKTLFAHTTTVPTSPDATCFGVGTGGSGKPATIPGATALGLLGQAARSTASLRPLLITDSFGFGLGLCGIGGETIHGKKESWYLKVDHKGAQVGGDKLKLHPGDEVLWYLAASYPYPDELWLQAPGHVRVGQPFAVRAFSYDEKGRRKPAAGVEVTGASAPTGADGRATVVLGKPARLVARESGLIPSARVPICVGGKCPRG
jgi:Domain of unknown function (DUF4430)